jgi:hypothetical protein
MICEQSDGPKREENKLRTIIDLASPTTISVDGVPVGPLDASVTSVQIDANYWSASLRVNGSEVTTIR